MSTGPQILLSASLSLCLIAGCSSSSGPKLAAADGTVTLQGQPLAGATVMFIPEKGPVAIGITEMDGRFLLNTGTNKGAVVGPVKVAVTANIAGPDAPDMDSISTQPKSKEEADQYLRNASEMQAAMASGKQTKPKSLIPEKYTKAESSGLSYEVKANGDNHFNIELK